MSERNKTISIYLSLTLSTVCLFIAAGTAHAQTEPQPGAINTSGSNLKNNARTGVGRFDPLILDLVSDSGKQIDSRKLVDADGDGKLSALEASFSFRVLPAGKYVLVITTASAIEASTNRTASPGNPQADAMALAKITVSLDGAKGGAMKKEMSLTPAKDNTNSARTRLGDKIDTVDAPLSAKTYRPGKPVYGNITFESDGKSEIKGVVQHDMAKSIIQNTR